MKNKKYRLLTAAVCLLAWALLASGCRREPQTTAGAVIPTETQKQYETGYVSCLEPEAAYCGGDGAFRGTFRRGTQVEYETTPDGRQAICRGGGRVYLMEGAIVSDASDVIPAHTLYVRTGVDLRDADGQLLGTFAPKGTAVEVTGCDRLLEDGGVHMYRVRLEDTEGYILPWYLTGTEDAALAHYDDGDYETHAGRGDRYGGGGAADLDYYPREKGPIPGNDMPAECRTLYINSRRIAEVDAYLELAAGSGINAFVVDITDGGVIGYAGDVMKQWCPSGAAAARNTVEEYRDAIAKIKDAGYYVIGRITTFNDLYFVQDHPEYAIVDGDGEPLKLSGSYWPSPFSREAWQYKVDLAVEAVELMGFDEIQFDYVRFPDKTRRHEKAGTIDFRNSLGESKAQAVQRFLMYAADLLHEQGAYISADVYGESAFTYVTAYGQYWPAISNVVDAISGMPYPDHFGAEGDWKPWEHPYDILYSWGQSAMARQQETATPAVVRTWVQAYNAIREPYNTYGPDEVAAQIGALRDAGCTGGFLTWNAGSSLDKYSTLLPAFAPPEGE